MLYIVIERAKPWFWHASFLGFFLKSNKNYHLLIDYCGLGNTILFTFIGKGIDAYRHYVTCPRSPS